MCLFGGILFLEFPDQFASMDLIRILPLVARIWVPKPLDEVLEFSPSSKVARVENGFDLVLFFIIDGLWWGALVIVPVHHSFTIRSQQVYVEHGVNVPLIQELELIGNRQHHLSDKEGSIALRG